MKISYATNNLRSLNSFEPIELRPITILVGANNSGKSTFLRSFPLLRQTFEVRTSEPILWVGDYVDFGNYKTAVFDNNNHNDIKIRFRFQDLELDKTLELPDLEETVIGKNVLNDVYVEVQICNKNNSSYLRHTKIIIEDFNISLTIEQKNKKISYLFNDEIISHDFTNFIKNNSNNILSFFNARFELLQKYNPRHFAYSGGIYQYFTEKISEILFANIRNFVKNNVDEIETDEKITVDLLMDKIFSLKNDTINISNTYPLNEKKIKFLQKSSETKILSNFYRYLIENENKDFFKQTNELYALHLLFHTLKTVGDLIRHLFLSSSYTGPSRVFDQRYYPLQGLDVSEISINSVNFPMFLLSLKEKKELPKFSKWVESVIGYEVEVNKHVGYISINVKKDGKSMNIVDSGYGISQILPVLAQIWLNSNHDNQKKNGELKNQNQQFKPITMEQPEVHLHPKHQAQIADALASAINSKKSNGVNPLFIVETHSDVLINRLGALIEDRVISHEDVQIVLFLKSKANQDSTEVSTSKFDEEGVLIDWPYGFFNY